jgi:hypothetical protein
MDALGKAAAVRTAAVVAVETAAVVAVGTAAVVAVVADSSDCDLPCWRRLRSGELVKADLCEASSAERGYDIGPSRAADPNPYGPVLLAEDDHLTVTVDRP